MPTRSLDSTNKMLAIAALCLALCAIAALGQVMPVGGRAGLFSVFQKATKIPPGETSFEVPITLDLGESGFDYLHVVRDTSASSIAVRSPVGTIVNSSNAESLGFTWMEEEVVAGVNEPGLDTDGLGLDLRAEGVHTIIVIPAGQPSGAYTMLVNTSGLTGETEIVIEAQLVSTIQASAVTKASSYRLGETATIAALLYENEVGVPGATVRATLTPLYKDTGSSMIRNARVVSAIDLADGRTRYSVKADFENATASSTWRFFASANSGNPDVRVVYGTLAFDHMSPGSALESANSILILAPTSPPFDPALLVWEEVVAVGPPDVLTLSDTGPGNALAADGVYAATFVTSEAAEFLVSVEIEGVSPQGKPFYRNAATSFMVIQTQATVTSITSEGVDANNNQKYEALRFNVSIDAQEPGEYTLSFQIKDTAEHSHTFLRAADLIAGANQIVLDVDAKDLLAAGFTNGPLSVVGVTLRREVFGRDTVVDYHESMGVTPTYNLGDSDRGSIYFTGQASEQALNLDGQSGYDVLRVQAEVVQAPNVAGGAMYCRVQGKLTDAAGFVVDSVTGDAEMREGANWVTIDFRGSRIARSNVNGPYAVRDVAIECSGMQDSSAALLTTASYLAVDFANVSPEFAIDLAGISIKPGETRHVPLTIRGLGAYEGVVTLSAPSAAAGLTPVVAYPQVQVDSLTTIQLSADAGVTPGNYSMQLSATDGTITRTATVPVLVSLQEVAVEVTLTGPWRLHPGMSTQLTATVLNAAQQSVTWSTDPGVGVLVINGNTATYTLGPLTTAGSETIQVKSIADPTRTGERLFDLRPPVLIALTPENAVLRAGQQTLVHAVLTNNSNNYDPALTWTVTPYPSSGGFVAPMALKLAYLAPSVISAPQTVTIEARFEEDPAAVGTTTLTLLPDIEVQISPTSTGMQASAMQTFAATVLHDPSNAGVTWAVNPSVGSVSASGLYTAPASIASQQTVTVTATSVEDGTKSASATVTLQPPLMVSVTPMSATLGQSQAQQFTATVTNAANTAVTWSVSPSVGSVNASGLYTAPSSIASQQTVAVTATSVEDGTKAAGATVTLRPAVAVNVSPTTASLYGGGTRQFTATVTNATNTGVTWTRSPAVGTLSASGFYTAPGTVSTQQTVTVTATSVEDGAKWANATVTLLPPANAAPIIQEMSPSNGAGWATVFKYVFSDSNGAADIVTAEAAYSTGSTAPFANSCWFVYSKSTNAVKLYNDAGTGFVSGQIVSDTSGGNLTNSRCSLVGGSLKAYPSGNTLTIFLGIGFTTGTARNYTARLKATDTAGAVAGFSPYGTWTVPATTAPPSSPAASGSGSPNALLTVSLVDPDNSSLYSVDIDDIQTLLTKTGGGSDSCHFFYFAPAEMIVLMDDDDVHWAGVSKAGGGGGALYNSKCMVNAAAAQKTYDSNTKRFGIIVPVIAYGTFTGTKYVYVGGSDLSGNIANVSWVHSWTTN